jgi:predicted AAA+ superfamily ATPase
MIQRTIFQELLEDLSKEQISLIVGPRQAGKTTAMRWVEEHVRQRGTRTVFLNLDVEVDRPFFESQQALVNKLSLELGDEPGVAFIDEIQRKENAGLFLKGLFDQGLPHKLVVSGSGSLELKEKIHESLVGRKRLFELPTLTFAEFVNDRTGYRYGDRLQQFFQVEKDRSEELLMEYLNFGGYPRVVTQARLEDKRRTLDEIYRSYLERDIVALLRVEKPEAFSRMIRLVAHQIGQIVNYSELATLLNISVPTLKSYLWNGEKTFVLKTVSPFFTNPRKELTKSPVLYFYDLGLRNYIGGVHATLRGGANLGPLFQNFIWRLLWEQTRFQPTTLHFWRTKDKAEVDFVLETGSTVVPIEVKCQHMGQPRIGRALRSFISAYQPHQAWVVNLDLSAQMQINTTQVRILPYYQLMDAWEKLIYPNGQSPGD